MAIDRNVPNTSQTIPDIVNVTRENLNQLEDDYTAADSQLSSRITNLESGRVSWDTQSEAIADHENRIQNVEVIRDEVIEARGNYDNLDARLDSSDNRLSTYTIEVSAARGSRSSLADRLAVFLDPHGNPQLLQIVTQFADLGDSWVLVSSTQIKTTGNQTGKYLPAFHVLVTDSEGDKYCQIDTVSYDDVADTTLVTMTDASPTLSGTISSVKLAIISLDFGLTESVGRLYKFIYDLYNRVIYLEGKI